jgi:hypothetical protein
VQVEEIEKAPFEILDNTDDVSEPMPAAIKIKPSKTQREIPDGMRRSQEYLASDVVSSKYPQATMPQRKAQLPQMVQQKANQMLTQSSFNKQLAT